MSRDDYIEVAERICLFTAKYPEGSLQGEWEYVQRDGEQWLAYRAYAYRTPTDPRPGIGHAWEPVPGRTSFTKGSELQNGETSAWGRCLAAIGIATNRGIASANEIRAAESNRQPIDTNTEEGRAEFRNLVERRTASMGSYRTPSGGYRTEGASVATAKQVGMLRRVMAQHHVNEAILGDYCADQLGFDVPAEGLEALTKAQASALIDTLMKKTDAVTVTRSQTADPADPWADVPPPMEAP